MFDNIISTLNWLAITLNYFDGAMNSDVDKTINTLYSSIQFNK